MSPRPDKPPRMIPRIPRARTRLARIPAPAYKAPRVHKIPAQPVRSSPPKIKIPPLATPPPSATPSVPKPPPLPNNLPAWAKDAIGQMDWQAQFHQGYADKVAKWLPTVINPLTEKIQAGEGAYRQQLANISSLQNQAAQYNPAGQVASMSPGGMVEDPFGYARQAQATANAAAAGYQQQSLGTESSNRLTGFAGLGQGLVANAAYQAQQLPLVYTQRRQDYLTKIQQWVAEQESKQFGDILDFASKQGSDLTKAQIAADTEAGRNARSQAEIDAKNYRANLAETEKNKREAAKIMAQSGKNGKPVGYKGMTPGAYSKHVATWVSKANEMAALVDDQGKGVYSPTQIADSMVAANLRPSDVLRIMAKRFYPSWDSNDTVEWYTWLQKYLPGKNSIAVMKSVLGIDPNAGNKPARTRAGLGD